MNTQCWFLINECLNNQECVVAPLKLNDCGNRDIALFKVAPRLLSKATDSVCCRRADVQSRWVPIVWAELGLGGDLGCGEYGAFVVKWYKGLCLHIHTNS